MRKLLLLVVSLALALTFPLSARGEKKRWEIFKEIEEREEEIERIHALPDPCNVLEMWDDWAKRPDWWERTFRWDEASRTVTVSAEDFRDGVYPEAVHLLSACSDLPDGTIKIQVLP